MTRRTRLSFALLAILTLGGAAAAQVPAEQLPEGHDLSALRPGHWVEVRLVTPEGGRREPGAPLVASSVELVTPQDEEELIGTVPADQRDLGRIVLLGQAVRLDADTEWDGLDRGPLAGLRVKLQGRYKGPRNFSVEEVDLRKPGSDRITARLDRIEPVPGSPGAYDLGLLALSVRAPSGLGLDLEEPLEVYPVTPPPARLDRDRGTEEEDDQFGDGIRLAPGLTLSGQLELEGRMEDEYDLDWGDDENRQDLSASARLRLDWVPRDDLELAVEWRHGELWREEDDEPDERRTTDRLGQTYLRHTDAFDGALSAFLGGTTDLTLGRQDFDDPREWLYDQNLDGLRVEQTWTRSRLELSWSTTIEDGSPRDRAADNWIAYLSNRDRDRHLAAYLVHRDFGDGFDERRTNAGLRAVGEFLPANDSWLELGWVGGSDGDEDLDGLALDLGTVWDLGPVKLVGGYAWASGDDDPGDGTDHGFRQTGLQDNNAKLGSVTSFRYYGELLDPELSNLQILTAGLVLPLGEKESAALVWHAYEQVEAAAGLRDSDLDMDPSGLSTDLGWEVDLVLSSRRFANWDAELVVGYFDPGDAFPFGQAAALYQLQLRYRF